jgi:inward rectifier potassium channel
MPNPPAPPRPRLFGGDRAQTLEIVGSSKVHWRDLYHFLIGASWTRVLVVITLAFLGENALFGLAYWLVGGIQGSDGSYLSSFFFSVQTLGTIGYGGMSPTTTAAHALVTVEALAGMLSTAMVTGLVFSKFARPTARVMFAKVAVVCDRAGTPNLMFRVANERRNHVVEATLKVALMRFEVTPEGERIRKVYDLDLSRSQSPVFVLTWTVMHPILPGTPLYGQTPESLAANETEIVLTFTGLDETLSQTIHGRHSYLPDELRYGARFADVLGTKPGKRVVDYTQFHEVVPAPLTQAKLGPAP